MAAWAELAMARSRDRFQGDVDSLAEALQPFASCPGWFKYDEDMRNAKVNQGGHQEELGYDLRVAGHGVASVKMR